MQVIIEPAKLSGTLSAPRSKSAMQRACAAALLRNGVSRIHEPGISNDDQAALSIIRQLGVHVVQKDNILTIESRGLHTIQNAAIAEIDCGESGLSMRMFTPICALSGREIIIKGHGSLRKRPLHFFDEVLPQLGVSVRSEMGHLPLTIKGPMRVKNIRVDGSASSQYITGLLMAYAAKAEDGLMITIDDPTSKPYIDLTLSIMQHFGLATPRHKDHRSFIFRGSDEVSSGIIDYHVEGDWSNAAFWLVSGAINGPVELSGLDLRSTQADRAIMQVLDDCGADVKSEATGIRVSPAPLKAFTFDATNSPDLFPPLVALAAYAEGRSRIKGLHRLRHKESDRALTLRSEFGKMGLGITFEADEMVIDGGRSLVGAYCSSHNDHRIAMALSVAAGRASGNTCISDASAVEKSYPAFFKDFALLGGHLHLSEE